MKLSRSLTGKYLQDVCDGIDRGISDQTVDVDLHNLMMRKTRCVVVVLEVTLAVVVLENTKANIIFIHILYKRKHIWQALKSNCQTPTKH